MLKFLRSFFTPAGTEITAGELAEKFGLTLRRIRAGVDCIHPADYPDI